MKEVKSCIKCGRPAFYYRPYSGEYLCKNCFTNSIKKKVKRTISKYEMFKYGDKIGIAVSGGKDSLTLLKILSEISRGKASNIVSITIDEGIKGYREEALNYAKKVSEELGINHVVYSFKEVFGYTLDEIAQKVDISPCAACGILRRRVLDIAAMREGVDVVATAHNLDDIIQTFFINVFNADIKRISWIWPISKPSKIFNLRRVRPFSEIYEKEIALYAMLQGLPFQTVNCPYMGEGIRSEVRLYLNLLEERHPGIKYNIYHTVLRIAERLNIAAEPTRCKSCGFPSLSELCQVCQLKKDLQTF